MVANEFKLPRGLVQRLNKVAEKTLDESAKRITQDMKQMYSSVIWDFYKDYTPKVYRRTYSLFEGSDFYGNHNNFNHAISKPNRWERKITMNISAKNYIDSPYNADTDWVFNRVFFKGVHTSNIAMKPTPYQLFNQKIYKYKYPKNLRDIMEPIFEKYSSKIFK